MRLKVQHLKQKIVKMDLTVSPSEQVNDTEKNGMLFIDISLVGFLLRSIHCQI